MDKLCEQHHEEINKLISKNELQDTHFAYMKKNQDEILKQLKAIRSDISELDQKYASKNVEKIVYGIVILFALSAVYFIMDTVGLPH